MLEQNAEVGAPTRTLRTSRLYKLAETRQLLKDLIPDQTVHEETAIWVELNHPRTENQGENTRIFIEYTNERGSSSAAMYEDFLRLSSQFDLDTFSARFHSYLISDGTVIPSEDPIEITEFIIKSMVNFSAMVILGLDDPLSMETCKVSLANVVAVLFDDPLDVFIQIVDLPQEEGKDPIPTLTGMWVVNTRPA